MLSLGMASLASVHHQRASAQARARAADDCALDRCPAQARRQLANRIRACERPPVGGALSPCSESGPTPRVCAV